MKYHLAALSFSLALPFSLNVSAADSDCTLSMSVVRNQSKQNEQAIRVSDPCPNHPPLTQWEEPLQALIKSDKGDISAVTILGWDGNNPLSERTALAFAQSKIWDAHLQDRKKKKATSANDTFVEVFNQEGAAMDLAEIFNRNGYSFELAEVNSLTEEPAKKLPFAKNHRALTRSTKKIPYGAAVWTFKISKITPSPTLNAALWSRVDQMNTKLKQAKTLTPALFLDVLKEGRSILGDPQFESDYQKVRAWAFDNSSFAQADKLSERAKPAFLLDFGGDSELKELNYAYFKQRAPKHSETKQFVLAYPDYAAALVASSPNAERDCFFPFAIRTRTVAQEKTKSAMKAAIKEWKGFAAKWKDPIMKGMAKDTLSCLGQ